MPRVREITSSNIADLIRIAESTNLSRWTAQNYLDELRTESSIMLAIEDQIPRIIGFVVGRVVPGPDTERYDAEIYNIAVVPEGQGRGMGQLLFDGFVARCEQRQVSSIWLEVRQSNHKAIRFYSRNGFEPVQKRPNFYKDPAEDGILMRLLLKR
jgi:[ribosomal protein S18]-alanine N-acetyltransferase